MFVADHDRIEGTVRGAGEEERPLAFVCFRDQGR